LRPSSDYSCNVGKWHCAVIGLWILPVSNFTKF
jgi:hypothetical protein